ncbi:hypothetical protein T4A_13729 [Trichinella pseudospiralis]|uniref:Uncharacterized protein n=1 Tax=Trichinella pseudospiralis TaxID=6337 RepID=A0A0V1DXL1_TRIPS|nr:hypothetical protein T4A_13729 [Trichinella pseudospiralis]
MNNYLHNACRFRIHITLQTYKVIVQISHAVAANAELKKRKAPFSTQTRTKSSSRYFCCSLSAKALMRSSIKLNGIRTWSKNGLYRSGTEYSFKLCRVKNYCDVDRLRFMGNANKCI